MIKSEKPHSNGHYEPSRFGQLSKSKSILSRKWLSQNSRRKKNKGSVFRDFKSRTRSLPNLSDKSRNNSYAPLSPERKSKKAAVMHNTYQERIEENNFLHESVEWLDALMKELSCKNYNQALRVSASVLQTVRDHIPVWLAVEFSRPLPLVLRGVYFKDWVPSLYPRKINEKNDFLRSVRNKNRLYADKDFPDKKKVIDALKAVFKVIRRFTDPEWFDDIELTFSPHVRELIHSPRYD